jgi:ribose transport system substrate-binding protein
MELLQTERASMSLEAVYQRTKFSKTSVYRILQTLLHRGYVARSGDGLYRLVSLPLKLRFGFAGQSSEMPFSQAVTESLQSAAAASGVDLLILDNRYDAATALKNAEEFVRSRIDLVIEFQVEQQVAPVIADRIARSFGAALTRGSPPESNANPLSACASPKAFASFEQIPSTQ